MNEIKEQLNSDDSIVFSREPKYSTYLTQGTIQFSVKNEYQAEFNIVLWISLDDLKLTLSLQLCRVIAGTVRLASQKTERFWMHEASSIENILAYIKETLKDMLDNYINTTSTTYYT